MDKARLAELRALCDATRYQSGGRSGWIKENALSEALDEIEKLKKENDILRGIAAKVMPCHYCGVSEIARCPYGFPGCSLADDVMAADEACSREIQRLRVALAEEKEEA